MCDSFSREYMESLFRLWKSEDPRRPILKVDPYVIETSVTIHNRIKNESKIETVDHRLIRIPMLSCLSQDSEQLIEIIRKDFWDTKTEDFPLNLSFSKEQYLENPKKYGGLQASEVDDLFFKGTITDGFFFEAGGYDFQDHSTSLYFELKYNWTGILVEPNGYFYQQGIKKNRNVKSSMVCLSFEDHPYLTKYNHKIQGTVNTGKEEDGNPDYQCLPLYSLLLAAGNPTVNYLRTLGTLEDLIQYLQEKGYKHIPGAHKSGFTLYPNEAGEYKELEIENELFVRNDIAIAAGL